VINGHCSQHRMSGPLPSMSWRFDGHSGTGPCGCQNIILLLCIMSLLSPITCLITWMAWCELYPRRRHHGTKTYSFLWSLRSKCCLKSILESRQRLVCFSFRHASLILSRSCDRLGSGTREWIFILKTRLLILLNTRRCFWRMWRAKYCAKRRRLPVTESEKIPNNNLSFSSMALRSPQSSHDPYDYSCDDEEYLLPNNADDATPGRSNRAARFLTAARLYLNSTPGSPQNWGHINLNPNDYHSDPMVITRTFWLLDITNWWWQQEQTQSKYADLSNVARNLFSIISHGAGMEASLCLGRDGIGWRQLKTKGETLREQVVVRQFAWATDRLLAADELVLDSNSTDKKMEMKRVAEEQKLHPMAKVHNMLQMWQGSQNQQATQK